MTPRTPQAGHVAQSCQLQHTPGPAFPLRLPATFTNYEEAAGSYLLRVKLTKPEGALTNFISVLSRLKEKSDQRAGGHYSWCSVLT